MAKKSKVEDTQKLTKLYDLPSAASPNYIKPAMPTTANSSLQYQTPLAGTMLEKSHAQAPFALRYNKPVLRDEQRGTGATTGKSARELHRRLILRLWKTKN